ncbi:carbohydrate ABC transporter permease [Paenibacillus sp.]|uniref:carbohydrate ABC transporter permease n=1 Tax=Paenibacillus sp. TaxID=58172 RepID=UPI002D6D1A8B|nr:carbohydrate ABC transporter permease [Paenibacillus sp.]HZG86267.1 carbohydrate ABC transporter permease [Paenibacillus sp.]
MGMDHRLWQWISHVCLAVFSILCIVPFVLLIASSMSSEQEIIKHGYKFIPEAFSLDAYRYLLSNFNVISRAYGITVLVTVVGTTVSLVMTVMLGYGLSKREMPFNRFFTFFVVFTLLFNGGLVPTYLIYTQVFAIKNTIWALLIPGLLMNGFNVFLASTFFRTTVPTPVLESARMDGAGEMRTFFQIVLPLSLPIMATIGLFNGIAYWNDWNNGLIYLSDPMLFSIQNLLNQMIQNIEAIKTSSTAYGASSAMELPSETVRMAIAVVGIIPILVAYPFFQKYFVKGIAIGAVKG